MQVFQKQCGAINKRQEKQCESAKQLTADIKDMHSHEVSRCKSAVGVEGKNHLND